MIQPWEGLHYKSVKNFNTKLLWAQQRKVSLHGWASQVSPLPPKLLLSQSSFWVHCLTAQDSSMVLEEGDHDLFHTFPDIPLLLRSLFCLGGHQAGQNSASGVLFAASI